MSSVAARRGQTKWGVTSIPIPLRMRVCMELFRSTGGGVDTQRGQSGCMAADPGSRGGLYIAATLNLDPRMPGYEGSQPRHSAGGSLYVRKRVRRGPLDAVPFSYVVVHIPLRD